eukprot:TRINITY_DN6869_c0_g1_i1.p1 TRINITY_DN6869_c0_g1~~TRINITY_DN6869_c0_g1_i1.p1  ORF type:complete len:1256 (+),score=209.30 TRINITY_DN6869_c0_g1_i1:31-3798(+)
MWDWNAEPVDAITVANASTAPSGQQFRKDGGVAPAAPLRLPAISDERRKLVEPVQPRNHFSPQLPEISRNRSRASDTSSRPSPPVDRPIFHEILATLAGIDGSEDDTSSVTTSTADMRDFAPSPDVPEPPIQEIPSDGYQLLLAEQRAVNAAVLLRRQAFPAVFETLVSLEKQERLGIDLEQDAERELIEVEEMRTRRFARRGRSGWERQPIKPGDSSRVPKPPANVAGRRRKDPEFINELEATELEWRVLIEHAEFEERGTLRRATMVDVSAINLRTTEWVLRSALGATEAQDRVVAQVLLRDGLAHREAQRCLEVSPASRQMTANEAALRRQIALEESRERGLLAGAQRLEEFNRTKAPVLSEALFELVTEESDHRGGVELHQMADYERIFQAFRKLTAGYLAFEETKRRNNAAIELQRVWRGHLGRVRAKQRSESLQLTRGKEDEIFDRERPNWIAPVANNLISTTPALSVQRPAPPAIPPHPLVSPVRRVFRMDTRPLWIQANLDDTLRHEQQERAEIQDSSGIEFVGLIETQEADLRLSLAAVESLSWRRRLQMYHWPLQVARLVSTERADRVALEALFGVERDQMLLQKTSQERQRILGLEVADRRALENAEYGERARFIFDRRVVVCGAIERTESAARVQLMNAQSASRFGCLITAEGDLRAVLENQEAWQRTRLLTAAFAQARAAVFLANQRLQRQLLVDEEIRKRDNLRIDFDLQLSGIVQYTVQEKRHRYALTEDEAGERASILAGMELGERQIIDEVEQVVFGLLAHRLDDQRRKAESLLAASALWLTEHETYLKSALRQEEGERTEICDAVVISHAEISLRQEIRVAQLNLFSTEGHKREEISKEESVIWERFHENSQQIRRRLKNGAAQLWLIERTEGIARQTVESEWVANFPSAGAPPAPRIQQPALPQQKLPLVLEYSGAQRPAPEAPDRVASSVTPDRNFFSNFSTLPRGIFELPAVHAEPTRTQKLARPLSASVSPWSLLFQLEEEARVSLVREYRNETDRIIVLVAESFESGLRERLVRIEFAERAILEDRAVREPVLSSITTSSYNQPHPPPKQPVAPRPVLALSESVISALYSGEEFARTNLLAAEHAELHGIIRSVACSYESTMRQRLTLQEALQRQQIESILQSVEVAMTKARGAMQPAPGHRVSTPDLFTGLRGVPSQPNQIHRVAASKIQRAWRSHKARQDAISKRNKRSRLQTSSEARQLLHYSATKLQAHIRRWLVVRNLERANPDSWC